MRPLAKTLLTTAALLASASGARAQSAAPSAAPGAAGVSRAVDAAVRPASAPAPLCPAAPQLAHKFAPGEKLRFHLDLFGADVGWFEIALEPPPREERDRVLLLIHARAHTSAFVSTNLGDYSGFAVSRVAPDLSPLSAREEVDEGSTHWMHALTFPPKSGQLDVRASRNGEPAPLALAATPSAHDLLSAFLLLRAMPLTTGTPFCTELFAGRRMWKMTGAVGPRETLETPLGRFNTVRIDLLSVRIDDAKTTRTAHLWITDDERRLPIAALAVVKGKTLRAQLESASGKGWSLGSKDR